MRSAPPGDATTRISVLALCAADLVARDYAAADRCVRRRVHNVGVRPHVGPERGRFGDAPFPQLWVVRCDGAGMARGGSCATPSLVSPAWTVRAAHAWRTEGDAVSLVDVAAKGVDGGGVDVGGRPHHVRAAFAELAARRQRRRRRGRHRRRAWARRGRVRGSPGTRAARAHVVRRGGVTGAVL